MSIYHLLLHQTAGVDRQLLGVLEDYIVEGVCCYSDPLLLDGGFNVCCGCSPVGYLEVIAEDDEPVTAVSDRETNSTHSQRAHKTMDCAQTTFEQQQTQHQQTQQLTTNMARENGVQREDSGIVLDPEYNNVKETPSDVITCNDKKPVLNGCDVSSTSEDEGSHGNLQDLMMNGDNKDSGSEEKMAAAEDWLENGQEEPAEQRPKRQITTVTLTTKEYLANGHCRTITETTRTVRDETGKETATKEIKIETTEPPMPQLKEEDETPTNDVTDAADLTEKGSETDKDKDDDDDETQNISLTETKSHTQVESPRIVLSQDDEDTVREEDRISPRSATPPPQCPAPTETETPKTEEETPRSSTGLLTDADIEEAVAAMVLADEKAEVQETADAVQSVPPPQVQHETIVVRETTLHKTPEVILKAAPAIVVDSAPDMVPADEELVVVIETHQVSAPVPPKPERLRRGSPPREPVVVVTDPTTESAVLQNNNSLLPVNGYLLGE